MAKADDFYKALGLFITEFAWVESLVSQMLAHEAEVSPQTAAAVFSGVRIDQAKDLIARLYEARGDERSERLKRAFAQLGVITTARNHILHYGNAPDQSGVAIMTNDRAAHAARAYREMRVTAETLQLMGSDLLRIEMMLFQEIRWPDANGRPVKVKVDSWHDDEPWRYRPPQPSPPAKAPPQRPQAPSSPQLSALGKSTPQE
jgi:hypothetical protein